jgi:hypothetical protein
MPGLGRGGLWRVVEAAADAGEAASMMAVLVDVAVRPDWPVARILDGRRDSLREFFCFAFPLIEGLTKLLGEFREALRKWGLLG